MLTSRDAPTGISTSISFQHPFKRAGGRTSSVRGRPQSIAMNLYLLESPPSLLHGLRTWVVPSLVRVCGLRCVRWFCRFFARVLCGLRREQVFPYITSSLVSCRLPRGFSNTNKPRHTTTISRPVSMIFRSFNLNPVIASRPR